MAVNRGSFDFECYDWVHPRCCGIMWGVPNERQWHFIADRNSSNSKMVAIETLQFMATFPDGVKQWWAHNGGKYDVLFLLEALEQLRYKASIYVASGRVISLRVTTPNGQFVVNDSYSVVPSKLSRAAESFALKSRKLLGDEDYSVDVRLWSKERLESGCRADCEVVLELLDVVESMLENEGGKLKATFSASAFSVVASKANIIDMRPHLEVNKIARLAYHGGRVEVFRHTPDYDISEWDINSSYPYSMRELLPWEYRAMYIGNRASAAYSRGDCGTIEAEVCVPEQYLPVLPWRHPDDNGLYFPVGTWRGWFAANELRYAESVGSCTINKVYCFQSYEARAPFATMIDAFFKIKSTSTGAKREFYKLCLNGAYGKFAQKPEKEELFMFPSEEEALEYLYDPKNEGRCKFLSTANLKFVSREIYRWSRQTHFGIASYITANSRIHLHRLLTRAKRVAYSDTDSIHADSESDFECSTALGGLKLERERIRALYAAPKIYALKSADGTGEPHYALKGFPVDATSFHKVTELESVKRERMTLAKSQLRLSKAPSRTLDSKSWSGRSMKRRPLYRSADGDTEPWSTQELLNNRQKFATSPVAKMLQRAHF